MSTETEFVNPSFAIKLDKSDAIKLNHTKQKQLERTCHKIVFSKFLKSKWHSLQQHWKCCETVFRNKCNISKHINSSHSGIIKNTTKILLHYWKVARSKDQKDSQTISTSIEIPIPKFFPCSCEDAKTYLVLLYYHYVEIEQCEQIQKWQRKLCEFLQIQGKIKIAKEGINGSLEGCKCTTKVYINEMMKFFTNMTEIDFKQSPGNGKCFDDLEIMIKNEICSLGASSSKTTISKTGIRLSPDEFHEALTDKIESNSVLLDCRNFYESKIGTFDGAVMPNLRKFSYFPEYVDKNQEIFKDKNVYMFCTGGIRCEKASAYVKNTGLTKEVFQLQGGIHKYLEKYPDGFYKGKLFVFDNRYGINMKDESTIVSHCVYCYSPYDDYELCTTNQCRQLVLSCKSCRMKGKTTCCESCTSDKMQKEQCSCTNQREKIPIERIKYE